MELKCCFILSLQIKKLLFHAFMKNITVLYSNNINLQIVITALQHFDNYYRKLCFKGNSNVYTMLSTKRQFYMQTCESKSPT